MIFTSYTYLLFLAAAFVLHSLLPDRWRRFFLIAASYFFYCTWKWEFGFLLLAVSLFNWAYGRWVLRNSEKESHLWMGIGVNLAALVYFKYRLFVASNAAGLLHVVGVNWLPPAETLLPPLGISFFTFQGIAYLVDIASGDEPLLDLGDFMFFKSFWPQLIAGPIVRLSEMRSQLERPNRIDYDACAEGCRRVLYGFVKKAVIADNLAPIVDLVFLRNQTPNALDCFAGVLGFGMQIYFDFSAYSDIAVGSAQMFGFALPENFNWPYVSKSPQEFWTRWHMTLSSWIRDYLFTPMNFSLRGRPALAPLCLLASMALCGLWHGAQWTYVAWGVWHGILLAIQMLFKRPGAKQASPGFGFGTLYWLATFSAVQAGWLLFRAESLAQAGSMAMSMLTLRGGIRPAVLRENAVLLVACVCLGVTVIAPLWRHVYARLIETPTGRKTVTFLKPIVYTMLVLAVIVFDQEARAFVYFQF